MTTESPRSCTHTNPESDMARQAFDHGNGWATVVTGAEHEKAGLPDRWAEMRGWLDAKISGLLAEAQTETVLMARNLRRDARLLTTVRDQMDAAESPVPAPQEDQ